MTLSQERCLKWMKEHGGDGVRIGNGRTQVLMRGVTAPFMWMTFKALIESGHIEEYGTWRLRLK